MFFVHMSTLSPQEQGQIIFSHQDPSFKIPITDGDRFNKRHMDPRVFAAESCVIPSYDDYWMSFTWNIPNDCNFELFASPVRKPATAEGVLYIVSYSFKDFGSHQYCQPQSETRQILQRRSHCDGESI